ncbi:hypothetical protein BX661DRAFT_226279 [Kickxella alabastrina]|uniref:uncharacterized protein n=1 Tax=Kickxella alabastrina TaxID=61397 RepID=UPI0022205E2D|nr:uncharacterized protein BX661DRAFT_226279 [Kickxella alabastrina]KAI7823127.1 hypothetical protein BX661DRAFT_226279 [Kickxella alabastrina]
MSHLLDNSDSLQMQAYRQSMEDPQKFWMQQALNLIDWETRPTKALITTTPEPYTKLNGSRRPPQLYDSPVTDTIRKITYNELLQEVKCFATVLKKYGVGKGDIVLLYMAMVPQTLVVMLACARLGAIHSVVFGGFAPAELAKRISDCQPKVVVSNTCGLESKTKVVAYKPLLDEAFEIAGYRPRVTIILQREQLRIQLDSLKNEHCWDLEMAEAAPLSGSVGCEIVDSNHPLYMLYTSGTTGTPKGIVRPCGPHAVALLYAQRYMYGLQPGETIFTFSDFGWTFGNSYTAYGPLLNGSTTVLFEGKPVGTPDAGQLYRVFSEHRVSVFLCAPTVVGILRRTDPDGLFRAKYDLTHMKGLFLAGERCTPEIHRWWISTITGRKISANDTTVYFGTDLVNVISDHWWQTESGSPMTGICIGYSSRGTDVVPIKFGSAGLILPGCDLCVIRVKEELDEGDCIDENPEYAESDEVGNIVVRLPLPPGFITTLWKDEKRFFTSYFRKYKGFYDTGDTGTIDSEGYVHILSRTDDVIKVAAHRLSTSSIEEVIFNHKAIGECCVVSCPDPIKGRVPVVFAALRGNGHLEDDVRRELIKLARSKVGPIVSLSGKILRKMIRMMIDAVHDAKTENLPVFADRCPVGAPATIEDMAVKLETWQTIPGINHDIPLPGIFPLNSDVSTYSPKCILSMMNIGSKFDLSCYQGAKYIYFTSPGEICKPQCLNTTIALSQYVPIGYNHKDFVYLSWADRDEWDQPARCYSAVFTAETIRQTDSLARDELPKE